MKSAGSGSGAPARYRFSSICTLRTCWFGGSRSNSSRVTQRPPNAATTSPAAIGSLAKLP